MKTGIVQLIAYVPQTRVIPQNIRVVHFTLQRHNAQGQSLHFILQRFDPCAKLRAASALLLAVSSLACRRRLFRCDVFFRRHSPAVHHRVIIFI